jgi:hypothetical protein
MLLMCFSTVASVITSAESDCGVGAPVRPLAQRLVLAVDHRREQLTGWSRANI